MLTNPMKGSWEEVDKKLHGHEKELRNQQVEFYFLGPAKSSTKPAGKGETLYDQLKNHIGRVHSGGKERLSENCGEKFTDYLVEKHKKGHL